MDATDHENIPTPNFGNLYSNLISTGFDYLNQDKQISRNKSVESSNASGTMNKIYDSNSCNEAVEKCKPLGWFYKNLFPEEQICRKACEDSKPGFALSNENKNVQPIKHSPHKKYILSNFDINALSPNSW